MGTGVDKSLWVAAVVCAATLGGVTSSSADTPLHVRMVQKELRGAGTAQLEIRMLPATTGRKLVLEIEPPPGFKVLPSELNIAESLQGTAGVVRLWATGYPGANAY